jgi:hypothetical protein
MPAALRAARLLPSMKGVVLRDAVRVDGCELAETPVVARPRGHDGRFEQPAIAKSGRPSKSGEPQLVCSEYVLNVKEENLAEVHSPLVRRARRDVRKPYFASSASTLAFLSTKRSSASRLRVRASFGSLAAGSRGERFRAEGGDFAVERVVDIVMQA